MPTYTNPQGQTTSISDAQLAANPTYWNGILSTGGFTKTSDVAQYVIPTPSVINSNDARERTQTHFETLDSLTARPVGPMEGGAVNKPGGVSAYKLDTSGTGATDTTGDKETGGGTKTSGLTPDQQAFQDAADAQSEEWRNQINQLEQFRTERDALNDQLISSIQAKFANLERAQRQANAQEEALVRIGGLRSGRERYASEVQSGIMGAAVAAGIGRLADLAAQEQEMVIKARMAASDEDYKLLNSIMEKQDSIRKAKLDTMTEIMKSNIELEKLASQRAKDTATALRQQMQDNRDMQAFALENHIYNPFYELGGTVYSTKTGMPVNDAETYQSLGGVGDGSDIQKVSGEDADNRAFVIDLQKQYPDANIQLTDTVDEASAKLSGSRIYLDKVRGPEGGGGSSSVAIFDSILQQSIDEGLSPQDAVFEAQNYAKGVGISIPFSQLSTLLARASAMKPGEKIKDTSSSNWWNPLSWFSND